MSKEMSDKIAESCEKIGKKQLNGIDIDVVDSSFLDTSEGSLHDHVAIQPSLVAYFGMKKKESERALRRAQERYDMFMKEAYAGVKNAIKTDSKKLTVDEIKSNIHIVYKKEHESLLADIEQAQEIFDVFDVYYEAIKQKGYAIKEMITIDMNERSSKDGFQYPETHNSLKAKDNIIRELQNRQH